MIEKFEYRNDDNRALIDVPSDIFVQAMRGKGVAVEVKGRKATFYCPFCNSSQSPNAAIATYELPSELYIFGHYSCPICGEKPPEEVSNYLGLSIDQLAAKPMLILNRTELSVQSAIEKILNSTNHVFLHGKALVVVIESGESASLVIASDSELKMQINKQVRILRYDGRSKTLVERSLTERVVKDVMARQSHWHLRQVSRIVSHPLPDKKGNINVNSLGHDDKTCCYFSFKPTEFRKLEKKITKEDAKAAYEKLRKELLSDFSFVDKADEAAAMLLMVTAVAVPLLQTSPMFLVVSADYGAGKTTLCRIASILSSTAKGSPVTVNVPKETDEFSRLLTSSLSKPVDVLLFENLIGCVPLNPSLCTIITGLQVDSRKTGTSDMQVAKSSGMLMMATGTRVFPREDMVRRTLSIHLGKPKGEYKKKEILKYAEKNRSALVVEVLKILKWGLRNQLSSKSPILSFGVWDSLCRSPIYEISGIDPACKMIRNIELLRAQGQEKQANQIVLDALSDIFQDDTFTTKKVQELTVRFSLELQNALTELGLKARSKLNSRRLGRWLSGQEGSLAGENLDRQLRVLKSKGAAKFRFTSISSVFAGEAYEKK